MVIKNYYINLNKVISLKKDYKNLELKIIMTGGNIITISYKSSKYLDQDFNDLIIALI